MEVPVKRPAVHQVSRSAQSGLTAHLSAGMLGVPHLQGASPGGQRGKQGKYEHKYWHAKTKSSNSLFAM